MEKEHHVAWSNEPGKTAEFDSEGNCKDLASQLGIMQTDGVSVMVLKFARSIIENETSLNMYDISKTF